MTCSNKSTKLCNESISKSQVPVTNDLQGNTMQLEDMVSVQLSDSDSSAVALALQAKSGCAAGRRHVGRAGP